MLLNAFLLYKGTPVVTAGYRLGFLPQQAGSLTISCAQAQRHTNTGTYTHINTHMTANMSVYMHIFMHALTHRYGHPSL